MGRLISLLTLGGLCAALLVVPASAEEGLFDRSLQLALANGNGPGPNGGDLIVPRFTMDAIVLPTRCSTAPTQCGIALTTCPAIVTRCAGVRTQCAAIWTRSVRRWRPSVPTSKLPARSRWIRSVRRN